MKLTSFASIGVLIVSATLVVGCATNSMTRSGFLGDYQALERTRFDNVLMYREPGFNPSRYSEILIEEVVVSSPSGHIDGLDAEQQREVLGHVANELRHYVGASRAEKAAGSVRLRVAVTDIETPNRAVNVLTTLIVGPVTTGGASLEFEAVDVQTGHRVAAATCFDRGHVVADFTSSYKLLGHAKIAISTCIERINSAWRESSANGDDVEPRE